jgi:hypothetical protein
MLEPADRGLGHLYALVQGDEPGEMSATVFARWVPSAPRAFRLHTVSSTEEARTIQDALRADPERPVRLTQAGI